MLLLIDRWNTPDFDQHVIITIDVHYIYILTEFCSVGVIYMALDVKVCNPGVKI